jgi:hypothetical protein
VLFDAIAYCTVKIEHRHRRIWRSSIRVVIGACQDCDWREVKLDFESTVGPVSSEPLGLFPYSLALLSLE